jgi:hypothetical protein
MTMMKKNVKKQLDIRMAVRLMTVSAFFFGVGAVVFAGHFIMSTLDSISSDDPIASEDDFHIQRIDHAKLDAIESRFDAKTSLDEPRQDALQNPFDMMRPVPSAPDAEGRPNITIDEGS